MSSIHALDASVLARDEGDDKVAEYVGDEE
jgi:hypothetical protein